MKKVKLLDCTLRDGGYVNNWLFGKNVICDFVKKMLVSNVEIVEVGFIRDVRYNQEQAVFPNMLLVDEMLEEGMREKGNTEIAVMAEISNPIPLEQIADASETSVDIIRVIVWKSKHTKEGNVVDALQESYEYCKGIAEKGYKLCVQPNRTDQYTDEEFARMLEMFAELKPYAIYVVDSWGTMYSDEVLRYMEIADKLLPADIAVGFHGHNNMMQAFSSAEKIIERDFDRDIILDASIAGIGRGAGNLNLELIAGYLNRKRHQSYNLSVMYEIYDLYIKDLQKQYVWGSSLPYMLSAYKNANPNYASFFTEKLTLLKMEKAYETMQEDEKVLYTDELAEKYIEGVKE